MGWDWVIFGSGPRAEFRSLPRNSWPHVWRSHPRRRRCSSDSRKDGLPTQFPPLGAHHGTLISTGRAGAWLDYRGHLSAGRDPLGLPGSGSDRGASAPEPGAPAREFARALAYPLRHLKQPEATMNSVLSTQYSVLSFRLSRFWVGSSSFTAT